MNEELFTIRGSVSGTGVYDLDCDLFHSTVSYVRIPKGLKVKIWCKRISGEAAEVAIEYTHNVTESAPTWKTVSLEMLSTAGEIILEKRRPLILRGFTGKEAFRLNRISGTGDSYVEIEVEM